MAVEIRLTAFSESYGLPSVYGFCLRGGVDYLMSHISFSLVDDAAFSKFSEFTSSSYMWRWLSKFLLVSSSSIFCVQCLSSRR